MLFVNGRVMGLFCSQTSYFLENPASIGSTYEDGLSELVHGGYLTDAYPLHDVGI